MFDLLVQLITELLVYLKHMSQSSQRSQHEMSEILQKKNCLPEVKKICL